MLKQNISYICNVIHNNIHIESVLLYSILMNLDNSCETGIMRGACTGYNLGSAHAIAEV